MPNYLNPTVVELDDVNFEKIDFAPGTGVFKSADFAILDAGSMQNLNITVDRDGERFTKQLQGVCFVDSWATSRGTASTGIDDTLAPVENPDPAGHGNYDGSFPAGYSSAPENNVSQLEVGPDPANFYNNTAAAGGAPATDPALAMDNAGLYHAFRGEMQLSAIDDRGYDFVDPRWGGSSVDGTTYVHPNPPSESGAGKYEFLTEPKFTEDVTYMTTDASGDLLYSDAIGAGQTRSEDHLATDENGEIMPYVPITGISGVKRELGSIVETSDPNPLLTQSNSIMHVNITRDIKNFDKNQTPEAFDQRRKRGTRDLLQGIIFCSMVKKIFNTGTDDADLELKNVDFSSAEERESGLFFVNIEDSEVVNSSDGIMLQQGNTSENYPTGVLSSQTFKTWITDQLGAAADLNADAYAGSVVADETKREFDLRREFLRLTDPNFGTISDFKRDADGRQLYLDASGVETTDSQYDPSNKYEPLYEYSAVVEGSGKDRTFTIPNDVLHKTLLAFNGYKRGRRAIDVDEEHGKVDVSGDWTGAENGVAKVVTTPSEWYPPAPLGAGEDPVNNRVDGQTLDDEIKYWNFRTAQGEGANPATDAAPQQELEYIPFVRYDKMMVYYTIDIFFQQKSLAEVTPDGLNALTIEGSTSTETGDVVTTEGVGYDFYDTKLNFILEWVLTHEEQDTVAKRNSSKAADQPATATHYQTVPGKKNVWEDAWSTP
ncbi:MAG: hypothetical protein CML47_10500 [Rhodobacteraceae bacterium]|nr:MAG: hypothetical protein CML47_10500 [Paracoccaceae bacterium]